MTLTRLESFPFDSRYDGFDDEGYPVYDRAVGAKTMRDVFAHFFSDGVFSDTTYPFRLTKAASGLAVTVNPGVIIINGGWGILPEATTLTLGTGTTAGVIKYAVFARYDNNDEHRTLYLRTDASAAGGEVPEPVTTEANVTEYRIGYITVPSNSSNLTNATITNEVGTSRCPYAVPLFDIDPAEVLEDLRQDAQAAYDKYYELLQSALDGTTAGHLQNLIDANTAAIAELEGKEIDPLALRAEMGLGPDGGVLQPPYGGTGFNSLDSLANYLLGEEIIIIDSTITTAKTYLPAITLSRGICLFKIEATDFEASNSNTLPTVSLYFPSQTSGVTEEGKSRYIRTVVNTYGANFPINVGNSTEKTSNNTYYPYNYDTSHSNRGTSIAVVAEGITFPANSDYWMLSIPTAQTKSVHVKFTYRKLNL